MGIEFMDIGMEQLEDILYETDESNHEDLSSFAQALADMYGGIDAERLEDFISFIANELRIESDAALKNASNKTKEKILEYLSEL